MSCLSGNALKLRRMLMNGKNKSVLLFSDFAPSSQLEVYSGTERYVYDIANWMNENTDIKVDILTPNWSGLPEKEEFEGVTIHRFKTHSIYRSNAILRTMDYFKAANALPRYDIYHSCSALAPVLSAILTAKRKGAKSVTTVFNRDYVEKNLNALLKPIIFGLMRQTDFITFNFWNVEEDFRRRGAFGKTPTKTIACWAADCFKPKKLDKMEGSVLYVGRMIEPKGIYVLLEAFAKLKEKMKKIKLIFVGIPCEAEPERLEKTIKEMGLEKEVEVKGFVTEKELSDLYNQVSVVAGPSLNRDGITWSFIEGVSCGTPVVSSEPYEMPVENLQAVAKPGDAQELSDKLYRLLSDKNHYREVHENALKIGATLFNKDKIMKEFLEVYNQV